MTIEIAAEPRHYVVAACEAWGHTRPLCTLVSRIAKSRPVTVTLFTTRSLYDRVENEISRNFTDAEADVKARIRVLALNSNPEKFFDLEPINTSFTEAYRQLMHKQPVTCLKTGAKSAIVSPPDAAIFDIFAYDMAHIVRKLSENTVKVYSWIPISAASALYLFGPSGGFGEDTRRAVHEVMESKSISFNEAAAEVLCGVNDKVVEIPGLPKTFDYEHFPQQMLVPPSLVAVHHLGAVELLTSCDGALVLSSHSLEPDEAISVTKKWFGERSCKTYMVGPMLASGSEAAEKEKKQSAKAAEIVEFMDRIHESHGPKSMLYISFGSIFWPHNPENLWAFLDVLFEKKIPFIMSHASPFGQIPDHIQERAKASGHALFSPWSPQQSILSHPATGWFVSHCGWNSLVESVSSGIPIICWPYQADQMVNTLYLTDSVEVAYELTEVRTGHGLKPMYRTGQAPTATLDAVRDETHRVLALAFSEDGAKKRKNVERMRDDIAKLWTAEGVSRGQLESFLDDTSA